MTTTTAEPLLKYSEPKIAQKILPCVYYVSHQKVQVHMQATVAKKWNQHDFTAQPIPI